MVSSRTRNGPLRRASVALPACIAIFATVVPVKFADAWSLGDERVAPPSQPQTSGPTQQELNAADTAGANWLTYNKGYLGYRYSPLNSINTTNARNLKIVCKASLGYQGEFQDGLVVYNGVIYAESGSATYAIDAGTCKTVWVAKYPLAPGGDTGTKGLAVAGGRVIRGTGDGHLIALDAKTGTYLWNRQIMDPSAGETALAAPIVWNNVVFIGKAGGEYGIRGAILAFRVTDGGQVWKFNTIPGPADIGGGTWPASPSTAYLHGGGSSWTTYSLDPTTGTLLVPVGNAGPDYAAQVRPGANLFTNSVIALDATTGTLKWWHQLVRNDDRDWDTSVVSAFDSLAGKKLAAAAGKDGILHVVDRTTGTLLYTAKLVQHYGTTSTPIVPGTVTRVCPIAAVQWNGPAFSPPNNMVYMTGIDWCATTMKLSAPPIYQKGQPYLGWNGFGTRDPRADAFGLITAFNADTGKPVWQYIQPSSATPRAIWIGGLVATGGGLVITGGTDGDLLAVNASTGKTLTKVATGEGIGGGVVTYTVRGVQRIAAAIGHNSGQYGIGGTATIVVFGLP